ncbi:MAG: helix-turn-helix domain-containing protein [Kiritimatiellae bacterium]|nr:helix-turn-helix domain-containing protein [Kiritimatiellia bacterium]
MNRQEKKRLQDAFFKKVGVNVATFKAMMDVLPDVAFYMKDEHGRIMALNRRNCDFCNIHNELDAIGKKSNELFPESLARSYVALDRTVKRTRRPIIESAEEYAADYSNDIDMKSVFPLFDRSGRFIGTACIYYRKHHANSSPDWHGILKPVTEYAQAHYAESITLERLAEVIHTTPSNFRRHFTQTFGISPGRYLTTIRLNAARNLLEATDLPIAAIAAETGFFDQSHLSKTFKRERGVTPGEYRRRHRTRSNS